MAGEAGSSFGLHAAEARLEAGTEAAWPPGIHDFHLTVDGQDATGLLAVPEGSPTTLVVVAHGWTTDAAFHRPDLAALAQAGALGVAMDYRGPRTAFKVATGVEDTVAATLRLQAVYPGIERTLLYGWSMGGEIALLAPLAAPAGTYDYVFSGAGVLDLASTWQDTAWLRADVERETGGTPAERPAEYAQRSPVARAGELPGLGVARVFLVHGVADDVVAIGQSQRMHDALEEAGVPVSSYAVTRDRAGACDPVGCTQADAPAGHLAGRMGVSWPFLLNRIDRAPDPSAPSLRGTYDAAAGDYAPSDIGP
jgi:dipeptidyl aminopeptidase/acylaminoacyl peptidase